MDADVVIRTAGDEQEPVAMFTGMPVELAVSQFPTPPVGDGLRVETRGGFHIEGVVDDVNAIPLFTRNEVEVRPGVWISAGTDVEFVNSRPGALRVQKKLKESGQALRTWADCESLTLQQRDVDRDALPPGARAYLSNERHLTFFKGPSRSSGALISLGVPSYSDGLLIWSNGRNDSFLRAFYQDDVVVEGWVEASSVKRTQVPRAERAAPRHFVHPVPNLEIAGETRLFESKKPILIRTRASKKAPVVGFIEAGSEVLVSEDSSGKWAGVLPKELTVTAPGGANFWVPASEVKQP